jgi:hypothetical protein
MHLMADVVLDAGGSECRRCADLQKKNVGAQGGTLSACTEKGQSGMNKTEM